MKRFVALVRVYRASVRADLPCRRLRRRCRLCNRGRIKWMPLAYGGGSMLGCDRCFAKVDDDGA